MEQMLTILRARHAAGQDTMLLAVTAAVGSTPRGAGAWMLVGAEGRLAGTIGGGVVEQQAQTLAQTALCEKRSLQHHFILRADGTSMVCGGEITVHFQLVPARNSAWDKLLADAAARLSMRQPGFLILRQDGALPMLSEEKSGFCLPIPIPARAIIFGGGHIALELIPLLRRLNFHPVVLDNRPEFSKPARFPDAETVLLCDYEHLPDVLSLSGSDYLIVMTNGHTYDFCILNQVLKSPFFYLGVIGSRQKKAALFDLLRGAGIDDATLCKIHTPIGLAIRASTPAEIAVSIAGELILTRAGG